MLAGEFYRAVGDNSAADDEVVIIQKVEDADWEHPVIGLERVVNPDGTGVLVVRVGDAL